MGENKKEITLEIQNNKRCFLLKKNIHVCTKCEKLVDHCQCESDKYFITGMSLFLQY